MADEKYDILFTDMETGVKIEAEGKTMLFPKGVLSAVAHQGENQTVDLKLMGSRKKVLSFRYDKCNYSKKDAIDTASALSNIL